MKISISSNNFKNYLKNQREFEAGNVTSGYIGKVYIVRSYAEPIAIHANGLWFVTTDKFSITTTKHTTQVKNAIETYRDTSSKTLKIIIELCA